mmetsp:Transcript_796/g.1581  ORF Transcript_796/g.1581 Transcript_796/m.1581 type:complete len:446 (+) Transcript_796:259-1596(+)
MTSATVRHVGWHGFCPKSCSSSSRTKRGSKMILMIGTIPANIPTKSSTIPLLPNPPLPPLHSLLPILHRLPLGMSKEQQRCQQHHDPTRDDDANQQNGILRIIRFHRSHGGGNVGRRRSRHSRLHERRHCPRNGTRRITTGLGGNHPRDAAQRGTSGRGSTFQFSQEGVGVAIDGRFGDVAEVGEGGGSGGRGGGFAGSCEGAVFSGDDYGEVEGAGCRWQSSLLTLFLLSLRILVLNSIQIMPIGPIHAFHRTIDYAVKHVSPSFSPFISSSATSTSQNNSRHLRLQILHHFLFCLRPHRHRHRPLHRPPLRLRQFHLFPIVLLLALPQTQRQIQSRRHRHHQLRRRFAGIPAGHRRKDPARHPARPARPAGPSARPLRTRCRGPSARRRTGAGSVARTRPFVKHPADEGLGGVQEGGVRKGIFHRSFAQQDGGRRPVVVAVAR